MLNFVSWAPFKLYKCPKIGYPDWIIIKCPEFDYFRITVNLY